VDGLRILNISKWIKPKWLLIVAGIVLLSCLMQIIHSPYIRHVIVMVLMYIILAVSYRFLTLSGQWTFAHFAMMGMSAFVTAFLSTKMGYPVWLSWPLGILAAVATGTIMGLICGRTRYVYFFFATWAYAYVIEQAWKRIDVPFGGLRGVLSIPPIAPMIRTEAQAYYLLLLLTIISLVVLYRLEKSRFGHILTVIEDNEELAKSIGIDAFKYRMVSLIIASVFCGLCGGFYAHYAGFVAYSDFGWIQNWLIVIYVMAGGGKTIFGPIIGTLIFVPMMQYLAAYREFIMVGMGAFTIFIVLIVPDGIEGLIWRLRHPKEVVISRALR